MQSLNKKSSISLIICFILFSLLGYFTGKYIDTSENDKLIKENEETLAAASEPPPLHHYKQSNFGFELIFPEEWEFTDEDNSYEVSPESSELNEAFIIPIGKFTVSSPTGSIFVYESYDPYAPAKLDNYLIEICTSNEPLENESSSQTKNFNPSCIDEGPYSILKSTDNANENEIWRIAEMHTQIDSENRSYLPYDGFYFQATSTNDLKLMKAIAESIHRF